MSEEVTRESGIIVAAELPDGKAYVERLSAYRDVAAHVAESFDYYLSNDTMQEIKAVTGKGGAVNIEFPGAGGTVSLVVFHAAQVEDDEESEA